MRAQALGTAQHAQLWCRVLAGAGAAPGACALCYCLRGQACGGGGGGVQAWAVFVSANSELSKLMKQMSSPCNLLHVCLSSPAKTQISTHTA